MCVWVPYPLPFLLNIIYLSQSLIGVGNEMLVMKGLPCKGNSLEAIQFDGTMR